MPQSPFGLTRTSVQRDHALIAPDGHVIAPLPQWERAPGIILISPRLGARFTQYLALPPAGVTAAPLRPGLQRFIYVQEGRIGISNSPHNSVLEAGHFAYFGPGAPHRLTTETDSRLLIIEKHYVPFNGTNRPPFISGRAKDVEGQPFQGDPDARLQILLPDVPEMDMAVNIFNFEPGAVLPFVETHIMEHGLMMIRGQGIYRLGDAWYPVETGDAIWMAPYCPQWFAAIGKTPAAYLYYKDINRDPMGEES
jgi:(S)-ureidoglycine aminohydrolase